MSIIIEKQEIEITRKPRRRKLYGHVIEDMTLRIGPKKIDGRKLPHRHGMGGPYYVAELLPLDDTPLFVAFHDIIKSLNYRESMALARALGMCYHTILNWKKNKSAITSAIILIRVIQWDRLGRPMKKVVHSVDGDDDKPVFFRDKVDTLGMLEDTLDKRKARWVDSPGHQGGKTSIIEKLGIPAKVNPLIAEILSAEKNYNPFDEVSFQSDEPQDSGWPYP